jgi:hypothetical protein
MPAVDGIIHPPQDRAMWGVILLAAQSILAPDSIMAAVFPAEVAPVTPIEWAATPSDDQIRALAPRLKSGTANVSIECSRIDARGMLSGCSISEPGDPRFDAVGLASLRHFRVTPAFAGQWHARARRIFLNLRFIVPGSDRAWTGCLPFCTITPPPPPPPAPTER